MITTFKKELVVFTDAEIEELYVGALPAVGRYFTKRCEKITEGAFRVEVEVPKGELYCHIYYNAGATEHSPAVMLSGNAQIGNGHWHTISKVGTDLIMPVQFSVEPPYVSALVGDEYSLRVIVSQPWVQEITLQLHGADGARILSCPVTQVFKSPALAYYEVVVPASLLQRGESFTFAVTGHDYTYYLGGKSQLYKEPQYLFATKDVLQIQESQVHSGEVVYHIFPDRFHRSEVLGEMAERQLDTWGEEPGYWSLFGGNLPGISEKLDHLTELGASVLYLTPIFEAPSNHRYDCVDYASIDPLLGSKEDLHHLVQACHQRGIKVVLDIVLNHCGTGFWAFQDVLKHGAESRYRDWFIIHKFPVEVTSVALDYRCWWNNGNMPEFNLDNPEVRAYLLQVCADWVREFAIDGWRLDVSAEMELDFLEELRLALQQVRPDIVLIGENWKNAAVFLDGSETVSGVTNYLYWWKSFVPFFVEGRFDVSLLAGSLIDIYYTYSHQKLLNSWNVLSSHDVPRFISMLPDRRDIYPAVFLQTMLPGTPIVYYGEEIGMQGLQDPLNRGCMHWEFDAAERTLLGWYQDLLGAYRREPALQQGQLRILLTDDERNVLVFSRTLGQEQVICVVNFSEHEQTLDLGQVTGADRQWQELLANKPAARVISIPAKYGCLLK